MKRIGNLFQKIISDENLKSAMQDVCNNHRWVRYPDKPNKTVVWIESHMDELIIDLKNRIINGFEPSPVKIKRRYDDNAKKWRDISEPRLYPDQCVHHALIQVLQPIMMRGMDPWCCGSIKKRGMHYGVRAIKRWMKYDVKHTRYCAELDIHHFYDSIKPEVVINRMKCLIKDWRTLYLIERIIKDGVLIGAYCSQWFANTLLQPLDRSIRKCGVDHYIRYMDNFTLFAYRKKTLVIAIKMIQKELGKLGLKLKSNVQIFPIEVTKFVNGKRVFVYNRLPNALGYRYGRGFTLIRKHTLLKLKRKLKWYYKMKNYNIPVKFAYGMLSRIGMLKHCNSYNICKHFIKKGTEKSLKDIIRKHQKNFPI